MATNDSNSLEQRLRQLIQSDGPIPLSVFMQLALFDKEHGYYATRPGVGTDFTTSPEISQVFGELLGSWVAFEWTQLGKPSAFNLIEIGPGNGTLMQDMMRVLSKRDDIQQSLHLCMVEMSNELREEQGLNLPYPMEWFDNITDIPKRPSIVVSNEYLDCLPIRQYVRRPDGWHETLVGLDEKGALTLGVSDILKADQIPFNAPAMTQDVVEISVAMHAIVESLADYFDQTPFRALYIDYGPANAFPGDTLRAYSNGKQLATITRPGEVDITADVNFSTFMKIASDNDLDAYGPKPQGLFLAALGGLERVNQLINANPTQAEMIAEGATRIMSPEHMGERFKAVCLSSKGLAPPIGF